MPAEVKKLLGKCGYNHIGSNEEYRYARDTTSVSLINIETGKTDFVHKTKIKEFWDNLADDDRTEMKSWSYEQFLERLNKAYCYYLKRDNKIVAIGGSYPNDLNICLWLLVTKKASKYPMALGRAVRTGIKKELAVYPECMQTVLALPDATSRIHHRFIYGFLDMTSIGLYYNIQIYAGNKKELLECVSQ